ncbi:hypothetical protein DUNSADRAFT_6326 [Dunaliella salina]|uniref:Encoded protein n=1 Tax=Dunaliella salina TaxID=3046 RepID=A0ABQ7GNH9_DUNSA|nr:hypothetical protein DUNSADRAFT_6326 [Dunaliella salina]|eukprot:KAF5836174.1 hypothetical protein DUNSADRAFT_6326 [Dunaliella salina]
MKLCKTCGVRPVPTNRHSYCTTCSTSKSGSSSRPASSATSRPSASQGEMKLCKTCGERPVPTNRHSYCAACSTSNSGSSSRPTSSATSRPSASQGGAKLCKTCGVGPVPNNRHAYCSEACKPKPPPKPPKDVHVPTTVFSSGTMVRNTLGTSKSEIPNKKAFYMKVVGHWPQICAAQGCSNPAQAGGHCKNLPAGMDWWIIPVCQSPHNKGGDNSEFRVDRVVAVKDDVSWERRVQSWEADVNKWRQECKEWEQKGNGFMTAMYEIAIGMGKLGIKAFQK